MTTTIFKLPESGEVALSNDVVIADDDFHRFVDAGGIIYTRGFSVVVRANGSHGNVTYIKPRTDDLRTGWHRAAEHFKKLMTDRDDEGTSIQLACLVLAECCAHRWSNNLGGPTLEMVALAENTLGVRIDTVVAKLMRGDVVP